MLGISLLLAAGLGILLLIAVAAISLTGLVTIVVRYFGHSDPLGQIRHAHRHIAGSFRASTNRGQ